MGLFGKKKEDKNNEVKDREVVKDIAEGEKKITISENVTDEEKEMLTRLGSCAGNVVAMLKSVVGGGKGTNLYIVTLYAAGLAGVACHEAVKATGGVQQVVECANGKKYYMGDAVNKYLHENKFAVTSMIRTVTQMPVSALSAIITRQAQVLGSKDFILAGNTDPEKFYKSIKDCWDGILENMTLKFCATPAEWPIFYGIVLQSVVLEALNIAPREDIFYTAVDIATAMAKMDKESL